MPCEICDIEADSSRQRDGYGARWMLSRSRLASCSCHAVRHGTAPEVDLDGAVRCMQVVDAIRRATAVQVDAPAAAGLSA